VALIDGGKVKRSGKAAAAVVDMRHFTSARVARACQT